MAGTNRLRLSRALRRVRGCLTSIVVLALLGLAVVIAFPALRHPVLLMRLLTSRAPMLVEIPVEGVRRDQIRDSWGAPRSGGRSHRGVDIFAMRGTPVISATEGIVIRVGTNELGGQVINVLGPGRQVHYYAHLDAYGSFDEGDAVLPGDTLGYVGDTGNARGTPTHLHYGVYDPVDGAVNPWPLLRP
jgi:murein DD-endopeptidase MepM/ murein hydrolase activator NlpD